MFPVGADTCLSCGRVEPRRGDEYPAGEIARYDWLFAQCIPNPIAKSVLLALVHHDRHDGRVFPKVRRLAVMTGYVERSVHRGLDWLEAHGWIERERQYRDGRRTANEYMISCGWSGELSDS